MRLHAEDARRIDIGLQVVEEMTARRLHAEALQDVLESRRVGLHVTDAMRRESRVEQAVDPAKPFPMHLVGVAEAGDAVPAAEIRDQRHGAGIETLRPLGKVGDEFSRLQSEVPCIEQPLGEDVPADLSAFERLDVRAGKPSKPDIVAGGTGRQQCGQPLAAAVLDEHAAEVEDQDGVALQAGASRRKAPRIARNNFGSNQIAKRMKSASSVRNTAGCQNTSHRLESTIASSV